MSVASRLYGAIEAGGTKFVCAVGDHEGRILDETRIETNDPTGWKHTDLAGALKLGLDKPIYLDTDVNAAALGEQRWGAGQHLDSLAYITVVTGIGVGVVHHGHPVHGLMHPELGHIYVRRHPADSSFSGVCPYHRDCLEGLASGAAIVSRTGRALKDAPPPGGSYLGH